MFHTRGLSGCVQAHPLGIAPEALEEWIYFSRAFSLLSGGGFCCVCRALECEYGSLGLGLVVGRAPEPLLGARGRSGVSLSFFLWPSRIPFTRKEGWSMPGYPRRASSDTSGEQLTGKSKWRPVPHSIGVG